MIKIENVVTPSNEQWKAIIMGMRNPMNSWDKYDSTVIDVPETTEIIEGVEVHHDAEYNQFLIGNNDFNLMKRLCNAGSTDRKFMRMITVYADITAPLYWWSEYDTYKVGTVANSCSKMHKLLSRPFEINDFSFNRLPGFKNEVKQFRPVIDEESELWKKIDADYDVSNQGRIRHGKRILAGSIHADNYIFVTLHGKQTAIHRLVAQAFVSNNENKTQVNHIDGNKQNNFASNLEWVTASENIEHSIKNQLQPTSINTYKGKFTAEQREEIKYLWDSGAKSKREIALQYGVSHTCINDIINDKYKYAEKVNLFEEVARPLVDTLNELRDSYFACDDTEDKKRIWYSILQLLPSSYNQKRTVLVNYEVLNNMYKSRVNHKLDEWKEFCRWLQTLPYSELITQE